MTSHQIDEIIMVCTIALPFIGIGLWFALALIRGGKVEE